MKLWNIPKNKGEIATTLTLISLAVMALGTFLGRAAVEKGWKFPFAQEACSRSNPAHLCNAQITVRAFVDVIGRCNSFFESGDISIGGATVTLTTPDGDRISKKTQPNGYVHFGSGQNDPQINFTNATQEATLTIEYPNPFRYRTSYYQLRECYNSRGGTTKKVKRDDFSSLGSKLVVFRAEPSLAEPSQTPAPTATATPAPTSTACNFDVVNQVRDENNHVLQNISGFGTTNSVNTGRSYPSSGAVQIDWHPRPLPESYRDTTVWVELSDLPAGWTIVDTFCEPGQGRPASDCPDNGVSGANAKINGLKLACNFNYTYGWKVRGPAETPAPTQHHSYQLDVYNSAKTGGDDRTCWAAADTNVGTNIRNQNFSNYECSGSVEREADGKVKKLIVSYKNKENQGNFKWQTNSCEGTLPENGGKCEQFLADNGSNYIAVGQGQTLTCTWNNPGNNPSASCSVTGNRSAPAPTSTPSPTNAPGVPTTTPSPSQTPAPSVTPAPSSVPPTTSETPIPTRSGCRAGGESCRTDTPGWNCCSGLNCTNIDIGGNGWGTCTIPAPSATLPPTSPTNRPTPSITPLTAISLSGQDACNREHKTPEVRLSWVTPSGFTDNLDILKDGDVYYRGVDESPKGIAIPNLPPGETAKWQVRGATTKILSNPVVITNPQVCTESACTAHPEAACLPRCLSRLHLKKIGYCVEHRVYGTCCVPSAGAGTDTASVDVNQDNTVNTLDYSLLVKKYARKGKNLKEDVNHDGIVNALDLSLLIPHLGEKVKTP